MQEIHKKDLIFLRQETPEFQEQLICAYLYLLPILRFCILW